MSHSIFIKRLDEYFFILDESGNQIFSGKIDEIGKRFMPENGFYIPFFQGVYEDLNKAISAKK